MRTLKRLKATLGLLSSLRSYMQDTLDLEQSSAVTQRQLARREESFLDVLERGVYAQADSPYRKLLGMARLGLGDVRRLVGQIGLEQALTRLYDVGVYLTLEEFKGLQPIRRKGLEFSVDASAFDNPLISIHYEGRTSGSRSAGSRVLIDFDHLAYDAAHFGVLHATHQTGDQPVAIWRPAPPDAGGLNSTFWYAKIGMTPERWFSQNGSNWSAEGRRAALLLNFTLLTCRLSRRPIPKPEFVPREDVIRVARWLADKCRLGTPAILVASASPAIRVCLAAQQERLDIRGSVFDIVGEPYTPAKAAVIAQVGARVVNRYGIAELGHIGSGCALPETIDDLHLLTDKVALIQREKSVAGASVQALVMTTVLPSCPKLMLNVESGDYANLQFRNCGCLLGTLGFSTHLTGLRSYDKLTSEGVTFLDVDLYNLLEEVLPRRFGGHPTDYQLVEEETAQGLPTVNIIVAPRVGPVDEDALVATILQALTILPRGGALMADQWRQGGTLHVDRREPFATATSKIRPLHVLGARANPPVL